MQYGRKRPPRLPDECYIGLRTISFTAGLKPRRKHFENPRIADAQIELLCESAKLYECNVAIYCLMPDHLHLMTMGRNAQSDGRKAMEYFKEQSGIWLDMEGVSGWQEGFFDHVIRNGDSWRNHARYIAMNPVRAGLVENCFDYPYLGAYKYDLADAGFGP